jgi:hypothetical protein
MPLNSDPFADQKALLAIVKNLERRWGLSIVSFLPADAQEEITRTQVEISKVVDASIDTAERSEPYVEFYNRRQLHSTHLTLTRSSPYGPVRANCFVRPGHHLIELFEAIQSITAHIKPIEVELDSLEMTYDGLGFLLLGRCASEESGQNRESLLRTLNQALAHAFLLSRRPWDTDAGKYRDLGCRIGFLKRPPPQGYSAFVAHIDAIRIKPIAFKLESITLVHHRYRTLAFPQEGSFEFQLGQGVKRDDERFAHELNLS